MKATLVEKNGLSLDQVLTRMSQRMGLANYAESTIASYCRSVRTMGLKIGKYLSNVEEDELHEYLLEIKDRMSQSSCGAFVCIPVLSEVEVSCHQALPVYGIMASWLAATRPKHWPKPEWN